jgi:hypothetical protein
MKGNVFGSAGFSAKDAEQSKAKGTVALRSQLTFASHALFTWQYLNADAYE